jgi:hypothetical protein
MRTVRVLFCKDLTDPEEGMNPIALFRSTNDGSSFEWEWTVEVPDGNSITVEMLRTLDKVVRLSIKEEGLGAYLKNQPEYGSSFRFEECTGD